jgi:hypothetical protein
MFVGLMAAQFAWTKPPSVAREVAAAAASLAVEGAAATSVVEDIILAAVVMEEAVKAAAVVVTGVKAVVIAVAKAAAAMEEVVVVVRIYNNFPASSSYTNIKSRLPRRTRWRLPRRRATRWWWWWWSMAVNAHDEPVLSDLARSYDLRQEKLAWVFQLQ